LLPLSRRPACWPGATLQAETTASKLAGGQSGSKLPHSKAIKDSSKLTEQSGDVYENKGPLWKTWGQSGNVTENKGSYSSKVGMLLK
jgi:hypothetical protein